MTACTIDECARGLGELAKTPPENPRGFPPTARL
jgi:hypothetical protein